MVNDPQYLREKYIKLLDAADNATLAAREFADDLFALDLTVYSAVYSLDSLLYSSFAESVLDHHISLHPEQVRIISQIAQTPALIVSAPTSFGKTYCVFEYIARFHPQNIVLVVPTLALVDEYVKRIIKKYHDFFSQYKIYTNIDTEKSYDFTHGNIFIITHDRIVQESAYSLIEKIDFLVIDEVYKLETDPNNDRVLVLNMAYYHLAKKASKYVLLAPFIKSIEDVELLEKQPVFYKTSYSPVVNEIHTVNLLRHEDRYPECQRLLSCFSPGDKTLIYFPTVAGIYKYVNEYLINEPCLSELDSAVQHFLAWARDEIHEDWCVIKAMERGYLIHNGQIPMGTRMFQLDYYESEGVFNRLMCTSTLLEGVNTIAKNIIITKPSRMSDKDNNDDDFTAFDFYNLVGRTGRLNKHFVGNAYYLRTPSDPEFKKTEAIRSIKFEITDDSKDINIQKGDITKHPEVLEFLQKLGISIEEYRAHIGARLRFETVNEIFIRLQDQYSPLTVELMKFIDNPQYGRLNLVKLLFIICEGNADSFKANIINNLLNKKRPKIKTVVNNVYPYFKSRGIDTIISTTISMKMSYIEHQFYPKIMLIRYFLELTKTNEDLLRVLDMRIIGAIEYLYYTSSKQKKMLIDLGIYERDIDIVIKIIGDDFGDTFELKKRLQSSLGRLQGISFISRYVIQSL